MKTAISLPEKDFHRFERLAARHGMNRSEFYRRAGERFARELEGDAELTALAESTISRAGQPAADGMFLHESEQLICQSTDW